MAQEISPTPQKSFYPGDKIYQVGENGLIVKSIKSTFTFRQWYMLLEYLC